MDWAAEEARWKETIKNLRVSFIDTSTPPIALVPLESFHELGEYSTTLPTGTPLGKIWKRNQGGTWWLGQYVESDDPQYVNIKWRELYLIIDHDVEFGRTPRATDELFAKMKERDDAKKAHDAMAPSNGAQDEGVEI